MMFGLTDENGQWKFYLSKDELIFIGIDKDEINNILSNKKNNLIEENSEEETEEDEL